MNLPSLIRPIVIAALLLAAVAVAATNAAARSERATLGAASGVSSCTASTTQALVRAFVGHYNRGEVAAAAGLWAREPSFGWFSASSPGARLGASAYNRATLAGYFRSRARAHEHLRVTELRAGLDRHRNIVNFAGKLIRRADGLAAAPPHDFKGAAGCANAGPILIVWSM